MDCLNCLHMQKVAGKKIMTYYFWLDMNRVIPDFVKTHKMSPWASIWIQWH